MTIDNTLSDSDDSPKRRGPKPSGVPRLEVFKKASKEHRAKIIDGGKAELKTFVDPGTKKILQELKTVYGVKTFGEVIDALAQQTQKKDK